MIGALPKLVNRMNKRPLMGDAIIEPSLSPRISQKSSSIDFGCSHPASTVTSKSSLSGVASPVEVVKVSNGSPEKPVWLKSANNTSDKRIVVSDKVARGLLINY